MSGLIFGPAGWQTEREFVESQPIEDMEWMYQGFGKAHFMVPSDDHTASICKKIFIGKDFWPDEDAPRCKSCERELDRELSR